MAALDQMDVKDGVDQETVDAVAELSGTYKYGWETEIEMEYAPKGLTPGGATWVRASSRTGAPASPRWRAGWARRP